VKGKDRKIGVISKIRVSKNRTTGREREIEVPIYYSTGIDDVGGCVDYLVSEGHWTKSKTGKIEATDIEFSGGREGVIDYIESNDFEFDLRQTVTSVWNEIERSCEVKRKFRYK